MLIPYNVKLIEKMNMHLNEHAFTHTLFGKHAFIYTDCFYSFLSLMFKTTSETGCKVTQVFIILLVVFYLHTAVPY